MDLLQDFVHIMQTDSDAVDEALDVLKKKLIGTDDIKHVQALRTAVEEQRELLKRVQLLLQRNNDDIDLSELLGLTDEPPSNLTSMLRLSPLHIPVTMLETKFNSIMHAFQASKVLYDKKYESCNEKESHFIEADQETRMKTFATASLKTVTSWGGSNGTICLDIQRWDANKISIMRCLMVKACIQNPAVKVSLLRTTTDIYEDTLPDNFWGHCKGQGQNTVGVLWKDIRDTETFDGLDSLEPCSKKARGSSSTGQSSHGTD